MTNDTKKTTKKATNYTPAQEKVILDGMRKLETRAQQDTLVASVVKDTGHSPRSVTAKISTMARNSAGELAFFKKIETAKDGSKPESKADLVEQVAAALGTTSELIGSLEKATKVTIKTILTGLPKPSAEADQA